MARILNAPAPPPHTHTLVYIYLASSHWVIIWSDEKISGTAFSGWLYYLLPGRQRMVPEMVSGLFFFYCGSVLDHRSLPPVFESQHGNIWRLFRLRLRLITFGGRSAHLACHVHKSGRKTSIIFTRARARTHTHVCHTYNIPFSRIFICEYYGDGIHGLCWSF